MIYSTGTSWAREAVERADMASIFIADELELRPDRQPDYPREKEAFRKLASQMVADPDGVVPAFVNLADCATMLPQAAGVR